MGSSAVVIADKDGGLMTELRAPKGDIPTFQSPSGDRNYWTKPIDITSTGDNTIHTPSSGRKFYVTTLVFSCGNTGDLLFKSGTTNISGPMGFGRFDGVQAQNPTQPDAYLLAGGAVDDAFVISVLNVPTMKIGGFCAGYDE